MKNVAIKATTVDDRFFRLPTARYELLITKHGNFVLDNFVDPHMTGHTIKIKDLFFETELSSDD